MSGIEFIPSEKPLLVDVAAIEAKLDHVSYGLAALKVLIDAVKAVADTIPTTAMRGTDNAMLAVNGALEATLTAIKGAGWTTETLKAIKDLIAAIPTTAMRGTDNALLAANYVTERGTDNAMLAANGALEATLTAIKGAGWTTETLKAIKDLVAAIPTTAMRGTDNAMLAANGALEATLTAIKGVGWTTETLKAIKDLVAAIPTTAMRGTDNALLAANYTAERGTDNAALAATALSTAQWTNALATALGSYTAALATALGNYNATRAGYLDELATANIPTDTDPKVMGRMQVFEKSITSAANAGDITVATITDQPCQIESVIIHADAAQTANMTSCGVFGGAGKVITFISATDAIQANLDAADKQVGWSGVVRLAATKTIVISLVGTGAAAVDLTIVVKYRASISGGYLV